MRRYLGLALLAFPISMGCSVGSSSNPQTSSNSQTLSGPGATNDEEITTRVSALLASDVNVGLGNTNEPHLAISPLDQSIVAAGNCFLVSLSFDGGKTFLPGDQVTLPRDPGHGGGGCDSVMTFDAHGRLFVESLDFVPGGETDLFVQQVDVRRGIATANRPVDASGTPCAAGGAGGPNGQCPAQVTHQLGLDACVNHNPTTPGRSADRPWFVADNRPLCGTPTPDRTTRTCSPFQDHLYVIWLDSPCQGDSRPQTARVASSSDHGATWISQGVDDPNDGNDNLWQYGAGIAANGDAYVVGHSAQIGETAIFRSTDGTATGFAGNVSIPFPAPLTSVTAGDQQCQCAGSFCASNPSQACTFAQDRCPGLRGDGGAGCECANNDCTPATSCPNQPIPGWQLCGNRSTTNGSFTPGTWSPYVVADPTNPNNIAVFATTDPNRGVTARDKFDIMYAVSTNAALAAGPSWAPPVSVTPGGMPLPATNQIFGQAASPVPGINGSCVTLAYYDDRNPSPPNAFGRNFMDVFVTVNPNLWNPSAKWQNEVPVNHTKFDPDLPGGGGDRNFYCGNTNTPMLGCEPAGWAPSTRMGEYFGVLQAFGVLWTGNLFSSPGVVNGQTILFNFSDGIAPVVTPPPTTSVSSCTPTQAQLGTATRTDECGMPPLGAATATIGVLNRGLNSVQWTATDGAGNVGRANQSVTVNDTTAPSITAPSTVDFASCDAGTVTVGTPTGTDDCNVQATFTGQVISKNGVALTPPITVVNGKVTLGFGTYVISWTASDGINTSKAVLQTVTVRPHIQAAGNFTIDDNAFIKDANGSPGQMLNSASGATQLGVASTSGSITSVPSVSLSNNAKVTGNITTAGIITLGNGATVTGTRTQHASVVLPALPTLPTFPPPVGPNITVNSGTQTLTPGSYPTVTLNSGATLIMTAGDFFIQNFFINSSVNVRLQVTPNTRVFVQNQFAFRSPFLNSSGTLQPILLGFAGSSLTVETTFNGTLLAPNGSVTFGIGSGIGYHGAFFAKNIEVRPASTLFCDDSVAQPLPGVVIPATCSDGVKDSNETDVDCGGSCVTCPNGKGCVVNSDCQNASCVNGICQQPTGQVSASLTKTADWGSGYCVTLLVTNLSAMPTKNWSVTVNTGASTIYDSWNGNFPASTGTFAITPGFTWNQAIAPGATNNSVGFCANRTPPTSGANAVVVSASGSF